MGRRGLFLLTSPVVVRTVNKKNCSFVELNERDELRTKNDQILEEYLGLFVSFVGELERRDLESSFFS
jgi:hypothetical protein